MHACGVNTCNILGELKLHTALAAMFFKLPIGKFKFNSESPQLIL